MDDMTGLELSPRKIEYIKYLFEKGDNVRTTEISAHMEVDPSTITKAINELASSGYVNHVPYRGFSLTEKGEEYAHFLLRRHRILSLMLNHYGLTAEESCAEVARFEAYVSKKAINTICDSMGHPTFGVCGRIEHDSCNLKHNHHEPHEG
ncbi:metal-dependent transcriptional regulator [Methanococcoides sp. LMO-2]|uniref:Metal-dependent transcriptional regulator n=1 Tax=Methanococcoides cohabitans TaxID=3136559 RepID=A0ABU9KY67_9EURY